MAIATEVVRRYSPEEAAAEVERLQEISNQGLLGRSTRTPL